MMEQGIPASRIVALTFTNKAAREMKERTFSLVGARDPGREGKGLFAGTFHSYCVRLLRRFAPDVGYDRNFTIYSEGDQVGLMKDMMQEVGILAGRQEVRAALGQLSRLKNSGAGWSAVSGTDATGRALARYQEALKLRNAMDFDDLLILGLRLLQNHPEVRERIQSEVSHVLVDEYQDTNLMQFEIVKCLTGRTHHLCVVGDDDQSIYSWRGAESRHILEFDRQFPGVRVIRLEQNYRCTPRILEAANAVIRNNARRHGKKLWSDGPPGETIRLLSALNEVDESAWIAADLMEARREGHLPWEEVGILYRANHLSRPIEQELRRMRIPYRVVGGQEFFERREVKDLLAYLQVILNPDDDSQLLRIINKPARGIGKTSLEAVVQSSRAVGHSIWAEMQRDGGAHLPARSRAGFESFQQLVSEFQPRFAAEPGQWAPTLRALIEELDFEQELVRTSKDPEEASSRRENVRELVRGLEVFAEGVDRSQEKPEGLREFIDSMLLRDREEKDSKEEENGYGVSLMTLHGAKGLEFKRVYLVGVEEGILPHDRVKMEGNVDEERRLFYVGLTRAKEVLTLSHCQNRKRYGQDEPCHPSTFLSELPESVLEHVEATDAHVELEADEAVDRFAALSARLEAKTRTNSSG